ncbi:MAG: SAM-dependent DNA methyltransferase [Proteobacteria bacterium]|nr:SAM-dependent DNA methyltransferase [Pseudomonadota bacterium]
MTTDELPQRWAGQFGLALVPLFETKYVAVEGCHAVLLDGGYGSFAMSVTTEEIWRGEKTADWAWSSNLPHHVTVTDKAVAVTRWDRPRAEVLSRSSVEAQIESFYTYLTTDRVRSSHRVVDHVLNLFRRMRSLVADARLPDERSIDAFLAFLAQLIERDRDERSGQDRAALLNAESGAELLSALPTSGVEALIEDVRNRTSLQPFRLFPSLAVRHAGSEIFQEAHFELLHAPGLDLFSYAGPAEAKAVTRGGAHFTPAALARSVTEQTLLEVEGLENRERLTVLDPACGSGAFLHEALRALRRLKFAGEIVLIGRDISSAAISMADFVVRHAAADWPHERGIQIDVQIADSLSEPLPQADVVLMNPPFMAWSALDDQQRDQMRQVLGSRLQGRGDFSMAFVTRAIDILSPGGALGVLLPSSLLTLQAAEAWRTDLLERTDLRLLASLGDYGLFAHALVRVAAAVMAKPTDPAARRDTTTALFTTDSAEATGNALRTLRRSGRGDRNIGEDDAWRLFEVPTATFRLRPTWRLILPKTEAALSRLMDAGAARMSDLFEVRQGVQTGDNKAFILDRDAFEALPTKEKRFFKPAVMNRSVQDGRLQQLYWVFYPYGVEGPLFMTEEALLAAVPRYAKRFLLPRRDNLATRAGLLRANREDWWGLSRRRVTWALDPAPRLVSKRFGGPGGFAVDLKASFVVVQGFAWFLKRSSTPDVGEEDGTALSIDDLLCAYASIMNSHRFGRVLELFSPHVAGGQFDLSSKYVDHIPIPNLADLARDERTGRLVAELADLGREPSLADVDWREQANRITTELYGGDFFDQV